MRQITFRTWADNATMLYPCGSKDYCTQYYGKCPSHIVPNLGFVYIADGDRNVYLLDKAGYMQYTGLKDKNGVEIYEGDLFACVIEGQHALGEVVFSNGSFFVDKTLVGWEMLFSVVASGEVVGNVHENPELLEEKS